MSKKVVNIIIFAIAGIGCLMSLWFSIKFDDNKKDLYYEVYSIQANNPAMVADLGAATITTLPDFVAAKSEEYNTLVLELKEKQYQRDVFYTYLVELKDLNEGSFAEYQAQFPQRAKALFAKSEHKDHFIKGFNNVKDYASLYGYTLSLEKEYDLVKQAYLQNKTYVRSFNNLLKRVGDINEVVSESKKTNDLNTLQKDIKSSGIEASLLNVAISFVYLIFFSAIAIVLLFSIISIVFSIKSSYQSLLGVALLVVIFVICYVAASPVLSKSAITMGHTPSEVKAIEAGLLLFYTLLVGAILSILVTPFINKIKKI